MSDLSIQIDVKEITERGVLCNMYTGIACVQILMTRVDYNELMRKGFFIRDGKTRDSAGVLNTTKVFVPEQNS